MTAEIAIGNRQALALAADSAVTIGRKRVWKHTNKLFSLGPDNDMAVMVHNTAELAGFPWEVVVKRFRAERAGTRFVSVEACAKDLMEFVEDKRFSPDKANRVMYLALFLETLERIKSRLSKPSTGVEFAKEVGETCDRIAERVQGVPRLPKAPPLEAFKRKYGSDIERFGAEVLGRAVRGDLADKLTRTVHEVWSRQVPSPFYTGVVVAGYGQEQFFPEVVEFYVDGKDDSFVRQWVHLHINSNKDRHKKPLLYLSASLTSSTCSWKELIRTTPNLYTIFC